MAEAAEGYGSRDAICARGREEPPGVGLVGDAFVNSLRSKTQLPVGVYGVNYPADVDPAKGANDMSAHVQSMAKNCPNTREVLGGYSLGAVAADLVVAVTQPSFGFKNPLPPGMDEHVAAVALFGNGTQRILGPVPGFSPAFAGKTIEVCAPGDPIPYDDGSFDLVLADYVLEHVAAEDAPSVAQEVLRVLKPGGWLAARTPNKWGMIGIGARAVPNDLHTNFLERLQPGRKAEDVFPVRYSMNTKRDLARLFPAPHEVVVYGHASEPVYFGQSSKAAWRGAISCCRHCSGVAINKASTLASLSRQAAASAMLSCTRRSARNQTRWVGIKLQAIVHYVHKGMP